MNTSVTALAAFTLMVAATLIPLHLHAQGRDVPFRDTIQVNHNEVRNAVAFQVIPDTARWDEAFVSPGLFIQMLFRDDGISSNSQIGLGGKLRVPVYRFEKEGCLYVEPSGTYGDPYVYADCSIGVAPYRWAYLFVGYGLYFYPDKDVAEDFTIRLSEHAAIEVGAGARLKWIFFELKYLMYISDWDAEIYNKRFDVSTTASERVPDSTILNFGVIF